jgi:hypothetical protein
MTHRSTALAFDTWREHAATQRRLSSLATKAVRRLQRRTQALALGRLQQSTAELRGKREVIRVSLVNA